MFKKQKSITQSKNFWTGILTILVAIVGVLGINADMAAATELTDALSKLKGALDNKDIALLIIIAKQTLNIGYHLLKTYFPTTTQVP